MPQPKIHYLQFVNKGEKMITNPIHVDEELENRINEFMLEKIGPKWRWIAERTRASLLRGGLPNEAETFPKLEIYVQRKLLKHADELIGSLLYEGCPKEDLTDAQIQSVSSRLKIQLDNPTLMQCLDDIQEIRCHHTDRQFDDFLLFMAYPRIALYYAKDPISVDVQAIDLALKIVEPNWERSQYVGPLAATDNQYGLIQYSRDSAIKLLYWHLPDDQRRPRAGDTVRLKYKDGRLTVSYAERNS
jgi:hypothetical protein